MPVSCAGKLLATGGAADAAARVAPGAVCADAAAVANISGRTSEGMAEAVTLFMRILPSSSRIGAHTIAFAISMAAALATGIFSGIFLAYLNA
jgi:hypothetical protein